MPFVSGGAPSGAAGGGLAGTYPNPTVAALASAAVSLTGGDITSSSATFVDLTGCTVTMTTGARRVLVVFQASAKHSTLGNPLAFDLAVDGTRQGGTAGLVNVTVPANGDNINASFSFVTAVLTAASHTFKIQWIASAATGTVYASATIPCNLMAVELFA